MMSTTTSRNNNNSNNNNNDSHLSLRPTTPPPIGVDDMVFALFPHEESLEQYYWGKVVRVRRRVHEEDSDDDNDEVTFYDVWFVDDDFRANIPRSELYAVTEVVRFG
jgi:hypothetical protein